MTSVSVSLSKTLALGAQGASRSSGVVLDDAIVDQGHAAGALLRVGVFARRGPAVRRPAGVADADVGVQRVGRRAPPSSALIFPAARRRSDLAVHDARATPAES